MRLGQLLKLYRVTLGLSTRDMAEQLGTSWMTISRLENGENVNLATFQKIMNFLFGKADYMVSERATLISSESQDSGISA